MVLNRQGSVTLDKKSLTERDICTKYITPAIEASGWDKQTHFLEEVYFTEGRIYVRGRMTARGKAKKVDYILYYKLNTPVAIIEAKDNNHSIRSGLQQALDYATILDIPCVFSSNGDGFISHDRTASGYTMETELCMGEKLNQVLLKCEDLQKSIIHSRQLNDKVLYENIRESLSTKL